MVGIGMKRNAEDAEGGEGDAERVRVSVRCWAFDVGCWTFAEGYVVAVALAAGFADAVVLAAAAIPSEGVRGGGVAEEFGVCAAVEGDLEVGGGEHEAAAALGIAGLAEVDAGDDAERADGGGAGGGHGMW
jgi:hypothetical protein